MTSENWLHMHNTAGGNTASDPPRYSGEKWSSRVQQTEAGSDVLTGCGDDVILLTTDRHRCLVTTNSSSSFFSVLLLSRFSMQHQLPHSLAVNPVGDLVLCSYINYFWISKDIIPGGQAETAEHLPRTFALTRAPLPETIRRNCRVQRMFESSYNARVWFIISPRLSVSVLKSQDRC